MVNFPTLSIGPKIVNSAPAFDPSMRSQAEDGQIISRRRFTGDKKQFEIIYETLPAADKVLLEAMQASAGIGADTISWTSEDPNDGATYTVRLSEDGIKFENMLSDYAYYIAKFTFIED